MYLYNKAFFRRFHLARRRDPSKWRIIFMLYNTIKGILPQFRLEGRYVSCGEICSGNINTTYHLVYALPDGGRRL